METSKDIQIAQLLDQLEWALFLDGYRDLSFALEDLAAYRVADRQAATADMLLANNHPWGQLLADEDWQDLALEIEAIGETYDVGLACNLVV